DGGVQCLGEGTGSVDVIVVAVGGDDGSGSADPDGVGDRAVVVGGIDDHHFVVVSDDPDVVLDLEILSIEGEDARGGHLLDHQITTTDRSTSPRSMRWNASSTSS